MTILLEVLSCSGYDLTLFNSICQTESDQPRLNIHARYATGHRSQVTEPPLVFLHSCQLNITGQETLPREQDSVVQAAGLHTARIEGRQFLLKKFMTGGLYEYALVCEGQI